MTVKEFSGQEEYGRPGIRSGAEDLARALRGATRPQIEAALDSIADA